LRDNDVINSRNFVISLIRNFGVAPESAQAIDALTPPPWYKRAALRRETPARFSIARATRFVAMWRDFARRSADTLDRNPATGDQLVDKHDRGDDQQYMDQTAANVPNQSQQPEQDE